MSLHGELTFLALRMTRNSKAQLALPSTRSEKEKQIRACNFQLVLVLEPTESIAVFIRHLSLMVAEISMKQCIKIAFHRIPNPNPES